MHATTLWRHRLSLEESEYCYSYDLLLNYHVTLSGDHMIITG